MNTEKEPTLDVSRRILAELVETAEHASLTRGLRGGEAAAAQAYNRVLTTFAKTGVLPEGMFEPLDADGSDYGAVGVQSRLLMAAIEGKKRRGKEDESGFGELIALAPFVSSDDLGRMVMDRLNSGGAMPNGLLVGLAPFLDSTTMGEIMRHRSQSVVPPEPPAPPTPPSAPEPPQMDLTPVAYGEPVESLESLVETLKRPDLTADDRGRVARRLAELAYEQTTRSLG